MDRRREDFDRRHDAGRYIGLHRARVTASSLVRPLTRWGEAEDGGTSTSEGLVPHMKKLLAVALAVGGLLLLSAPAAQADRGSLGAAQNRLEHTIN